MANNTKTTSPSCDITRARSLVVEATSGPGMQSTSSLIRATTSVIHEDTQSSSGGTHRAVKQTSALSLSLPQYETGRRARTWPIIASSANVERRIQCQSELRFPRPNRASVEVVPNNNDFMSWGVESTNSLTQVSILAHVGSWDTTMNG